MPVVIPQIVACGPTGEYSYDPGQSPYLIDESYTLGWYIQLDEHDDLSLTIEPRLFLLDSRLPQYLDPYQYGDTIVPYLRLWYGTVTRSQANRLRLEVKYVWKKTPPYTMSNIFPGQSNPGGKGGDPSGDLTQLAPKFTYEWEQIDDVFDVDKNGNNVVNTAADVIEPLPTRPTPIRVIKTTRFESKWDEVLWDKFNFKTNLFAWRGNPDQSCLSFPPTVGDYTYLNDTLFYPVTYTIKIKIQEPLHWDLSLDSYGFRELKTPSSPLTDIFTAGGKVSKPWPLDVNGKAIDPTLIATTSPAKIKFRKYDMVDFDLMKLVLPLPG